jgi:microcystin-dependent protein
MMNISKLKILSISVCCLVASVWSDAQGMDEQRNNEEPSGKICSFAGEKAPSGWLLCDGAQYSSREYPRLYEVVKMKYVPSREEIRVLRFNAENNYKIFCVPDLRGRVIVGVDGGAGRVTSDNTLGASGGEEKHQLTIDELASHSHKTWLKNHQILALGGHLSLTDNAPDPNVGIQNTGKDKPHNNMQPYQILNYIISTGEIEEKGEILSVNSRIVDQLQRQISELNINLSKLHMKVDNTSVPDSQACAKAWVVFDGSQNAKILDSYGVSSVIRDEVGVYTVNFSHPFKTSFYCSSFTARLPEWGGMMGTGLYPSNTQTRNSIKFATIVIQGPYADAGYVSACFYGNQ